MARPLALGVGIAVAAAAGGAMIFRRSPDGAGDAAVRDAVSGAEVPRTAGPSSPVPTGRDAPGLASGGRPPVDPDTAAWRCREGIPPIQDAAQAAALGIHVTGVVRCADGEPVPAAGLLGLTGRGEPASRAEVVDGAFEGWVARDGVYEATVEFGDEVVTVPTTVVSPDRTSTRCGRSGSRSTPSSDGSDRRSSIGTIHTGPRGNPAHRPSTSTVTRRPKPSSDARHATHRTGTARPSTRASTRTTPASCGVLLLPCPAANDPRGSSRRT